jgi:hypothetical protein
MEIVFAALIAVMLRTDPYSVRSEVLTVVKISMLDLTLVKPRKLVRRHQHFGETLRPYQRMTHECRE